MVATERIALTSCVHSNFEGFGQVTGAFQQMALSKGKPSMSWSNEAACCSHLRLSRLSYPDKQCVCLRAHSQGHNLAESCGARLGPIATWEGEQGFQKSEEHLYERSYYSSFNAVSMRQCNLGGRIPEGVKNTRMRGATTPAYMLLQHQAAHVPKKEGGHAAVSDRQNFPAEEQLQRP